MKKTFNLLLALVASASVFATEGALSGKFTINDLGDQIVFSQGNLQYIGTWQFAEHQWDTIGNAQYDDHRDLFGWGTGDAPNKEGVYYNDYTTFTDWGTNAITNGGNTANTWHTLTAGEWEYLFYTRQNAAILFGLGSVNGINGTILLPDNWTTPAGVSFTASTMLGLVDNGIAYYNSKKDNFSHNTYSMEQWSIMESAGAVFLPAAGAYIGSEMYDVGSFGYYWSATPHSQGDAYELHFFSVALAVGSNYGRASRLSVRLVQDAPSDQEAAIENTAIGKKVIKRIVDGQLLIEKNGKIYNATGVEVN